MEVITIESQVFKEIVSKIDTISKFVLTFQKTENEDSSEGWVDSYDVCKFLKISTRTLQRLRSAHALSYSQIRGKNYYRISEIQHLLDNHVIRRSDEHLQNLIENYRSDVEKRGNFSKNK